MRFSFGEYTVEIDVSATREYYLHEMPENDCECSGCENFRKFAEDCPEEIKRAFAELGIDNMKCVCEIIPYDCEKADYEKSGGNLYGGFFPVVGKVIGTEPIIPNKSTRKITDRFEFYLSKHCVKPDDFPGPSLQVEIYARIPWLIAEENAYVV
ncbi:MAG: hypothetical protein K2N06_10705 [Oscillospiraceae bacterium]|nr:hypothetical protein [Oscillospiraceae bacterium]